MYTLGELKLNCYKLIDPSDEEMSVENIQNYESDSTYSFYFLNMLPSINSAITRIVQACILPLKRIEIDCLTEYKKASKEVVKEDGSVVKTIKKKTVIKLSDYIDDIYKIKLIEYENTNGDTCKINYRIIGDYLEVTPLAEGNFIIYYYPKIKSIESIYAQNRHLDSINDLDLSDIGLEDSILTYIPYYVKADLLEQDKPSEANLARNTFEQYISSFEMPEVEVQKTYTSWWRNLV
jgi:hypothetical protein